MSVIFGQDSSGNNNTWTAFNFSSISGAGSDLNVDTPTNFGGDTQDSGGEVNGNYATLIPGFAYSNSGITNIINGGLTAVNNIRGSANVRSSLEVPSGKWYVEWTIGFITSPSTHLVWVGIQDIAGFTGNGSAYNNTGAIIFNGESTTGFPTFTTGDIIGCAYDIDNNTATYFKNGTQVATGVLGVNTKTYCFWGQANRIGDGMSANFGQREFAYTPPNGFKSLNTKNLNEQYPFVTGPDLVWIKRRNGTFDHNLFDTIRGAGNALESSTTAAQFASSDRLTSFNSNGFTVGSNGSVNASGDTYVGWCWDAGSRTVGNQDGTINSTVRANKEAGFSIVSYTGNGTTGATIGHGLGVTPKMVIVKNRDTSSGDIGGWLVSLDASVAGTKGYVRFDTTGQLFTTFESYNVNFNSTVIETNSNTTYSNRNGEKHIAYCWAEIPGYSKFGSFTGNAQNDNAFVHLGFKPKMIILKRIDATSNWIILDSSRSPINYIDDELRLNTSGAEAVNNGVIYSFDFLSNGIKIRNQGIAGTWIYMAFAEMPFRYSTSR
jgi:hypothetical protein